MFGRLPRRYRVVLVAASVAFFVLAGVWVAQSTPILTPPWGTVVGAGLGVLAAFVLVHDFNRRSTQVTRIAGRPRR